MVTPVSKYFTEPENSTCITLRDEEFLSEARNWVEKNCNGLFTVGRQSVGAYPSHWSQLKFYFSDKNDAISFKIIWG